MWSLEPYASVQWPFSPVTASQRCFFASLGLQHTLQPVLQPLSFHLCHPLHPGSWFSFFSFKSSLLCMLSLCIMGNVQYVLLLLAQGCITVWRVSTTSPISPSFSQQAFVIPRRHSDLYPLPLCPRWWAGLLIHTHTKPSSSSDYSPATSTIFCFAIISNHAKSPITIFSSGNAALIAEERN